MEYPRTRAAWHRCCHRLLAVPRAASAPQCASHHDTLYTEFIVQRYSAPQRHYHTMRHLEDMFTKWDAYCAWCRTERGHQHPSPSPATISSSTATDEVPWLAPLVLELSILFHDAVYDPKQGDNEEASARLASQFLREHVAPRVEAAQDGERPAAVPSVLAAETLLDVPNPRHLLAEIELRVTENIHATKRHLSVPLVGTWSLTTPLNRQEEQQAQERPTDTQLLMDIDLSILGSGSWADYQEYAARVRQEYSFYAQADFIAGRSAFLASFLAKPQWFKTAYFYYRYEARARDYTQRELSALRDGKLLQHRQAKV